MDNPYSNYVSQENVPTRYFSGWATHTKTLDYIKF